MKRAPPACALPAESPFSARGALSGVGSSLVKKAPAACAFAAESPSPAKKKAVEIHPSVDCPPLAQSPVVFWVKYSYQALGLP